MKNLRKEFPVLSQYTYLNTASSGLLYDSLLEFRQEHDLDFLIKGSLFRNTQASFLNSVRTTIADFFNANSENTVLTQNFSVGFNTLLNGFPRDRKVLLLDQDYPSVNFAVTSKGFEICYAKIDATLEKNITEAIDQHQPDIFAFSLVQYLNGIAIDVNFIKQLKIKNPNLLIIADGSQFCGTSVFDFSNSGIDILGTTAYKWLLGGYGVGFFLFQNDILDQITPESYKKSASISTYDPSYINLRARFECGSMDTLAFGSLQHSLQYLSKIGMISIQEHMQELLEYAKEELTKMNVLEDIVVQREYHSSILTIQKDQKTHQRLLDNDIITTYRENGIRISLHFYNTMEDIQKLLISI